MWRHTSYCSWHREIEARSHCCSRSRWLCVSRLLWPSPFRMRLDVVMGKSSLHQTGKATSEKSEKQCRKLEPGRNNHMYKPNTNDRQNSQPAFKNNRRARHGDAYCSLSTWEVEAGGLLSRAYFGRNRLTYLCLSVTSDFTE